MKVRRASALLAVTALLGLCVGTSSASAQGSFKTNSGFYPVLSVGQGTEARQRLSVNFGEVFCDAPTIWAPLNGPSSIIGTTAEDSSCYPFNTATPLKMNGCKLTFHAGSKTAPNHYQGTFDIGPEGCGPITTQLSTCKISIPAQTGLKASYENLGDGTIEVTAEATNLKYTQAASGCSGGGTFSNGQYSGTWIAKAYTTLSSTGTQVASKNHVFSAGGKEVKCGTATFAISFPQATQASITPTYTSCEAFGFLSTTITMNGCTYSVQATKVNPPNYSGTAAVVCPEGKAIDIKAGTCRVNVPAQTGLSGVTAKEGATTSSATANVSGIEYVVVTDGFGCPFNGTGSHKDGTYTGETSINKLFLAQTSWSITG